jgi:hypothetical protein
LLFRPNGFRCKLSIHYSILSTSQSNWWCVWRPIWDEIVDIEPCFINMQRYCELKWRFKEINYRASKFVCAKSSKQNSWCNQLNKIANSLDLYFKLTSIRRIGYLKQWSLVNRGPYKTEHGCWLSEKVCSICNRGNFEKKCQERCITFIKGINIRFSLPSYFSRCFTCAVPSKI